MATSPEEFKRLSRAFIRYSVSSLGLSTRTENRLNDAGILRVMDLVRKKKSDLEKIPGFGKKALAHTKFRLAKVGLKLGMSTDEVVSLLRVNGQVG